jgi:ABC-type lipoprotein release transport system permease subunit
MESIIRLRLVLLLAARNVWLHRTKSIAIAALLGVGTTIMTMGLSLLTDIDQTMEQSIINSVAGHFQVFSEDAKDDLALFGGAFMGKEDIGTIEDFSVAVNALTELSEIQDVIPMGIDMGMVGRGNELDDAFESIRNTIKLHDNETLDLKIAAARQQISLLRTEILERAKVSADKEEIATYLAAIDTASQDTFWNELKANPEDKLMYLESKVAPASGEKSPIYLRYLGTDLSKFQSAFSKFKIVSGQMVPTGERGMLLAYKTREDYLKNIAARLFDTLQKMMVVQGRTIAEDAEVSRNAADLGRQYLQIQIYIDATEMPILKKALADAKIVLRDDTNEAVAAGIQQFLHVDDGNFVTRHKIFYDSIAPLIKLYEIYPGDSIVVRSYTRSGYIRNLAVRVYGIFSFEGIERSDLAGSFNLIDLVTFRELYGQMNADSLRELAELRATSGVKQVERETAEAELFGDSSVIESTSANKEGDSNVDAAEPITAKSHLSAAFDPQEIASGLALNLAVKMVRSGNLEEQKERIIAKLKEHGLKLKVVDWKEASGFVGQFVTVVRVVLITAVVIILLVALVIINNTLVIAVYNRVREIGTMRALGAQKSFVTAMFLAETGVIGIGGAIFGILLSSALLFWARHSGIPAPHEVVEFLFSGPRLYPTWHFQILLVTPMAILVIAVIASMYTASNAGAVRPSEAMAEKE